MRFLGKGKNLVPGYSVDLLRKQNLWPSQGEGRECWENPGFINISWDFKGVPGEETKVTRSPSLHIGATFLAGL
jgi:hypothetical protein